MKNVLLFTLLLIVLQNTCSAQKTITGLWSGSLINDSTTARNDQSFEIALTQYKEKIYGYSRRTFLVNDTLYYSLKRVKGKVDGNTASITEDEYISYNFAGKVDKGVKVTYTFSYNPEDSIWKLDGNWKTNESKKRGFYAVGGSVSLKREKDLELSKLFSHLEELKLDQDVPFYVESKKPAAPVANTQNLPIAKNNPEKKKETKPAPEKAVVVNTKPSKEDKKATAKNTEREKKAAVIKDEPASAIANMSAQTIPTTTQAKPADAPAVAVEVPVITKSTIEKIKDRTTAAPQIVSFKSDSLQLSLYDNGEIDGDTVSILLNDVLLLEKQGLKATAIKKTIHVPQNTSELTLVLFAENLGRYPPNTGLLVVRDGEDVYQLRFSADLSQNASIVFKRKQ